MKKIMKIFTIVLIVFIVFGTFVFLYFNSQPDEEQYQELKVTEQTLQKVSIITGKIIPRNEVSIKPQINGIITEIYKEPGQTIKENEVIAKLKVIPDMSQLSDAESRVRLAELNLRQAHINYSREKELYDKDFVSQEEYDKILQEYNQAEEEKTAAQDALEVIRDGISSSNATGSSTLVRSTISGLLLDIPVKVGNSVIQANIMNDGTTVATVANMSDLIFDGQIDETEVGKLKEGSSMTITIGALPDYKLTAILEYVSPQSTNNNGANQFEIKAALNIDSDNLIKSGYSANAKIVIESAENVLTIPESALEFSGDSTYVYILKESGAYQRTSVTTGLSDGINIEIKNGLQKEDKVRGPKIY